MTSADPNQQKLTQLRKLLIKHFSLDELRVLCFDLDLEYEELSGSTRSIKIQGMIEYLQRRNELSKLLDEARDQRPNVAWPAFENGTPTVEQDQLTSQNNSKSFIHEKSGLEMLLIPAGEFLFVPIGKFLFGEKEQQKFLRDYWMAKTPVTNAHYARFVQDTGQEPPKHWKHKKFPAELANHPVVWVSWHNAVAYSEWAGLQLPTEQQWQKAAQGNEGYKYPWGNEWKPYSNTAEAGIENTTPVGHYSPFGDSPYGCVDMSGNVWEWIADWMDREKTCRGLRGGSWSLNSWYARVSDRYGNHPYLAFNNCGFRAVAPNASGS